MTKRLATTIPTGWAHPQLWLHRSLHTRRVLQYRARVAVIALMVLLIAVIAWKLSPWWLLLAIIAAALPTPIKPAASLRELEVLNSAYTTALSAPPDEFGFQRRLESQALAQQKQANLPAYPWLEGAIAAALCSLLLVFPVQPSANSIAGREVVSNPALTRGNDPSTPDSSSSSDAPPVLDAPSRDATAPVGASDAKPGQAASGGSLGEPNVGDLKPGGGNASEDPGAISREFMEALERGAVRDAGSTDPKSGKPNPSQVEDNDAKAAQQGSGDGDQSGSQGGKGSQDAGQNKPNQNGSNQNKPNQSGQGNQPQPGAQNPNSSSGNQSGSGQQGNQPANSSSGTGTQNGNRSGQQNGRGNTPNPDDGQSGAGQGQGNRDNSNPTTTSRGTRGASDPQAAQRPDAQSGKLEYLPGTQTSPQVRSGALQLPGDPRVPLTGTPGTPAYKRAAEGAVLDPKLPPEYQELLKNYYR